MKTADFNGFHLLDSQTSTCQILPVLPSPSPPLSQTKPQGDHPQFGLTYEDRGIGIHSLDTLESLHLGTEIVNPQFGSAYREHTWKIQQCLPKCMPCLPDLLDISPRAFLKGQSRQAKFCLCFSGSLSKECFAASPFHDPTSLDKGGCRTAATHNWANKKIFPVQPSKMLILI